MTTTSDAQGNPAAVGLAAFGLTTVLLSLINAGVLPAGGESVVLPLALAYGGLIQIIVGLLEFKVGNTFGMTVFMSYGAFWWWFALLLILGQNGVLDLREAGSTIGVALLLWGVITALFWIASFRLSRTIWSILLLVVITFFLLGLGNLMGATWLTRCGGWVGLAAGSLALYGSFAMVMNATFGRDVLPLGVKPMLG